jgi:hypothetical protein
MRLNRAQNRPGFLSYLVLSLLDGSTSLGVAFTKIKLESVSLPVPETDRGTDSKLARSPMVVSRRQCGSAASPGWPVCRGMKSRVEVALELCSDEQRPNAPSLHSVRLRSVRKHAQSCYVAAG